MKPSSLKSPSTTRKSLRSSRSQRAAVSAHLISREELTQLQNRLREAQETLEAIRGGEVDAVMVSGPQGSQVYSLAGAEQPYRVYVERMQEGAVTVSAARVVLYCNQRFADMLTLPLARVIGSDIASHLASEAWEKISAVFADGSEVVKHECVLCRAEGDVLPVHLTAGRLPLEGQDVMCLVVTDLTDQKEKANLRLAKEVAEKASVAKDDFLAALSHELRTPLTPALMAAVTIENDATLPDSVRKELSVIRRNVELEARLIDDLLDLTRIARGKLEMHVGWMDVHAVLERALEICRSDVGNKQQHLILHLNARYTHTAGDAVRIQQALWNLIRNASKFTPEGGSITISTGNTNRETIWLQVEDTGIGFNPEAAARLFDAFEQGGRHITRQFGGLGLGLAITRSIAESHRGSVHAESRGLNRGAIFRLELPLRQAENGEIPVVANGMAAVPEHRPLRVLLVEDHKDTRASMERLLRRYRHEVKSAESAQRALDLAASEPFDVVISDLGLPDQSGLTLMRELRDRYSLKGIAMSGYGMEEDVARSREAGFMHHLTKPVGFDRLKLLLAEIAGGLVNQHA